MYCKNKYEYLNQEVRLPLLKLLKKYNLSPKDQDELENILWYIFNQYDKLSTLVSFYEKKYGSDPEDFKEFIKYYDKTHAEPVDYRKLSQESVYGDDDDDCCKDRDCCLDEDCDCCPFYDECYDRFYENDYDEDYDQEDEDEELDDYDAKVSAELDKLLDELFDEIISCKKPQEYFIKDVIFNGPCTIVLWSDGTKTIVRCGKNDTFDKEKGLAMAIIKKIVGNNKGNYNNIFKKYCEDKEGE